MLSCPKCRAPLRAEAIDAAALVPCHVCGSPLTASVFPALLRDAGREGSAAEAVLSAEEAGCFYHPQKKAVIACEGCGRFLCALCDLELHGQHLCPICLSAGRRKGKLRNLENERILYDNIALALATLPVLLWPFTLITAPAALYIVIRYWKEPTSIVPRTKIRFIFAFPLALAQVAGWILLGYFVFFGVRT